MFRESATYDAAGNLVTPRDPTGTYQYGYNAADQLVTDTVGGSTTLWTYDNVGNRSSQTTGGATTNYTYDAADELTAAGTTTFNYDARGNGGALFQQANAAYQQAQPDLVGLDPEADRVAQCTVGSYSRAASTAGTAGQFSSETYVDPKSGLGLLDDLVGTFTGFWNTASYEKRCFNGGDQRAGYAPANAS